MNILSTLTEAITGAPPKATEQLLCGHVVSQYPEAAALADAIRGVCEAQRRWRRGFDGTRTYTEQGAKARFYSQFSDGNFERHMDEATRTRGLESCISEYAGKAIACKGEMTEASNQGAALVNGINRRLLPAVEKVHAARVATEKDEAARFGLSVVHSALTVALAKFANALRVEHVGSAGNPPSQMAPHLTLD